ncbi:gamma carbonic anhydrase family protein [Clostridium paraputrificum]|uniref:gamma carbonic anhydrase family protein n=1 Tax=Clostridium TaxID=1485 RepID=UPI003D328416
MIKEIKNMKPLIDESCFIAENAVVVGDVAIGKNSSVWYGTCIRSDMDSTTIGDNTNIQENSTVHNDFGISTKIGSNVTIGHNCIIHGCEIEDNVLIGMGSIILNGAIVGKNTIVGAGSLVTQNKVIPSGVLCMGSPAKVIRDLTEEELSGIEKSAIHYIEIAEIHK